MLLHAFVPASRANGPGLRAVVYFQGCSLHCAKCWNPSTHEFRGVEVPVLEVVQRFEEASRFGSFEGATFSGGEPMQQAEALLELMRKFRRTAPAVSLGMFTGYTESELACGRFVTRLGANCGTEVRTLAGGSGASGLRGDGPLRPDPAVNCATADEQKSKARTI